MAVVQPSFGVDVLAAPFFEEGLSIAPARGGSSEIVPGFVG
jgi:hypothetical protein